MRIIFFLWVICLFKQPALTQTPRPSQKEVKAQMEEAKRKAQKMITELENQISEAKLKRENPETIKEMEAQLATVKKMQGVIDKAGTAGDIRPKTLPQAKKDLPKYVSPIVRIHLKQPVVTPTDKEAKDNLLWYMGKK